MIDSLKLIEDLSNAGGISGFEDEVADVVRKYCGNYFDVFEDSYRNLCIYQKNHSKNKPVLMLDGHSDEVGFMVQSIRANGTLKFLAIGGWFPQNIPSHKVRIKNASGIYIEGIVASKPPHFMTQQEKASVVQIEDMVIDIGASDREEVIEKYKIEPGAPVIPDVKFSFNHQNGLMLGKAFDNRLGCACVVETLHNLMESELNVDLVGSISAQEEVGTRGAMLTSRKIKPDIAIVFEGTPADDTFTDRYECQAAIGRGPQIRHRDSTIISNPRFIKFARAMAKEKNIIFQDAVRTSGGTNAGNISLSNNGVPVIVLGIPVRYAHSFYGYSSYTDYRKSLEWAEEIVKNIDENIITSF